MSTRLTFALRSLAIPIVIGAIVFSAAGGWDFPFVWALLSVMVVFYFTLAIVGDAGMAQERQAPGPGNQDRLTQPIAAVLMLAHWIVAGLDIGRFHWSPTPWGVQLGGLLLFSTALCVNFWALLANKFYSSVVRVQSERGQTVIDTGPYRIVRHPGYAATLVAMFAGGVTLGSWVAMIPVLGFAALFLRRTLLEDNLLKRELPGYLDYAQRVRYRLVPGVF
jgi:protein-S-isoprenylcysteine O-methyltransferase Ste14